MIDIDVMRLLWQGIADLPDPGGQDLVVLQLALKRQLGLGMGGVQGQLEVPKERLRVLSLGDLLVNLPHAVFMM
jgi:hypothetical protein